MNATQQQPIPVDEQIKVIVHEIRNPLQAIDLATQMLSGAPGRDDQNPSYFDIIKRNVKKIEELLKEILQAETPAPESFAPVNISALIDDCLLQIKDRLDLNKITVFRHYASDLMINGSGEQFKLVLTNLFTNAIEAKQDSGSVIWVAAFPSESTIKLVVKDNGRGMDANTLVHMGDPNFTTKSSGLGRGMCNVKQILKAHGATFAVNSDPGLGTTIVITFSCIY
ncbi:sensor histidine kinase [Flavihumibacter petaseus]|uniref:histidine kinase n=1 Tax=Flavihumibacter petaseus NBRC 106054 TaxID=1220578 RepID=A0A0E9N2W0_9BACT|nr:HAMP domain-containing sensor histidine kinase [Flavihumibacter petaseus]GAO43996.1 putative two-component histidine kinase [Flavihumibacter petaseus NBRC 106054]